MGHQYRLQNASSPTLQPSVCYPPRRNFDRDIKDFKLSKINNSYKLESPQALKYSRNKKEAVLTSFLINTRGELEKSTIENKLNNLALSVSYSHFQDIDSLQFPYDYNINIWGQGKQSQLKLDFKKIQFNTEIKTPFFIPEQYKPMTVKNE